MRLKTRPSFMLLAGLLAAAANACGGSDTSSSDPRCQALCQAAGQPPASGYGDYCDTASVAQCDSLCGVRIAGTATLCSSCLLEKATFGRIGQDSSDPVGCDSMKCTITNPTTGQMCSYPPGDDAAAAACNRKVYPLQTVSCSAPKFRPVTDCASICNAAQK